LCVLESAGKYKFEHSRVRQASESIAFFGGGDRENEVVTARFNKLLALQLDTARQTWRFQIVNRFFLFKVPAVLVYLTRMQSAAMTSSSGTGGDAAEFASTQTVMDEASTLLFDSFGKLLSFGPTMARLSGKLPSIAFSCRVGNSRV
jgi:ABC-type uncharacterized transport system fused permease/ATPase subunit